jgi:hypothetical protein
MTKAKETALLDEAMEPALSDDTRTVFGKTFKLMSLKVKNQKQFMKLIAPLYAELAEELGEGNFKRIPEIALLNYDLLPRLVKLIAEDADVTITDEEIENSREQPEALMAVVIASLQKNEALQKVASDFLAPLKTSFVNVVESLKLKATILEQEALETINAMTISPSATDGLSETSES